MNLTNKLKYDDFTAFPAFWQVDKNKQKIIDHSALYPNTQMQSSVMVDDSPTSPPPRY